MASRARGRSRGARGRESGGWTETVRALGIAILLALAIRSFVIEPFKIPSGSMIPTLLVGDYLVVNKFAYGLRLPVTGQLLVPLGEPARGDVIVFRFPDDPSQDYIKRIVGLPGDRVEIRDDRVWVNEQLMDLVEAGSFRYMDYQRQSERSAQLYREINPEGRDYSIIREAPRPGSQRGPWIVPPGEYFVMGDNRDNSRDSREWNDKFVSADQIKGKAFRIHWSWVVRSGQSADAGFVVDLLDTLYRVVTFQVEKVRWERIGRDIYLPVD